MNAIDKRLLAIWLGFLFAIVSCRQEDDTIVHYSNIETTTYTVAIVLPLDQQSGYKERFERTVDWAMDNLHSAQNFIITQTGDSTAVDLKFEWHDESTEDLGALANELANRDDVLLTIGPLHNDNINTMAPAFANADKPLIVPCGSSEDVIRRYSVGTGGVKYKKPFLWSLCETDVSQCEALLAKAWEGGARQIALIAPNDTYGKTFTDWIPFISNELGMTLASIVQFDSKSDLKASALASLSGKDIDCAILVTRTPEETRQALEARKQLGGKGPRFLFTGGALSAAVLDMGQIAEGIEGVAQYAEPSTGFQIAYESHFNTPPAAVEAQLYDAVLLTAFTAFVEKYTEKSNANEIIRQMTSLGEEPLQIWSELGLRSLIMVLKQGHYAQLMGASGLIRFDEEAYTSLLQSAYVHWMVYNGQFVTIDYMSTDGGKRVEPTLAAWNWQAKQQQTIYDTDVNINYSALNDQWAVLIQGSNGWRNYRHQADVLNVYQMLKENGYDDDHIILIVSDDIAYNTSNKEQGKVQTRSDGNNLYATAQIDYSNDTLSAADIVDIMSGRQSPHLPKVLPTDIHSNVTFFWSGHGQLDSGTKEGGFTWRDGNDVFTYKMMTEMLQRMHSEGKYRKLLMLFEPCYSENMIECAAGIPGVLCFSSAGKSEQSFADYWSIYQSVWMSDRFSNNFVTLAKQKPKATFKDLYSYLVAHTLGSHVHVANAAQFGNLCKSTIYEFTSRTN